MQGSRVRAVSVILALAWATFPAACAEAKYEAGGPKGIFPDSVPWYNSKSLTEKDLDGKVVIIDFWCYTCINCIRTLPYVQEWHKRYAQHGLVIIGVHAPEFEFEKTGEHVKAAIEKFKLTYPIVMDNERHIWNCFSNQFWPAKFMFSDGRFLLDQKGGDLDGANRRARFEHFGEGEYQETERQIQEMLRAKGVKAEFPPLMKPLTELDGVEDKCAVCYPTTRELYTNYRGFQQDQWGTDVEGGLGRSRMYRAFEDSGKHAEGHAYLVGTWQVTREYTRHPITTKDYEDYLLIRYKAVEVNAVVHLNGPGKGPVLVKVTLDGKPLPKEKAGSDVVFEDGQSFLKVTEPRMYRVVSSKAYGIHELAFWPKDDRFSLYAFTFGSCLKPGAKIEPAQP